MTDPSRFDKPDGRHAILIGREVKVCNLMTFARWLEATSEAMREGKPGRRVAEHEIDGITISTVFLALDHSFGSGPPQWFKTMVFGGSLDGVLDRYETWAQAEAGHAAVVAMVTADVNVTREAVRTMLQRVAHFKLDSQTGDDASQSKQFKPVFDGP